MYKSRMSIAKAREQIHKGIHAMIYLFESFTHDELNEYLKDNNYNFDNDNLAYFVSEILDDITNELLEIKEIEYDKLHQ